MTIAATNSLTSMVLDYYDRRMLESFQPQLFFKQFAVPKELPKREGDTVVWHRWNLFTKGRRLAESAAGNARGISASKISANLIMIGDHAKITTYIDMITINSVVEGAIDLFADSAALTVDWCVGRLLLWRPGAMSATLEQSAATGYLGASNLLSGGGDANTVITSCSSSRWQAPLWSIESLSTRSVKLSSVRGGSFMTSWSPDIIRQLVLKLKVKNAIPFEDGYFKMVMHPDTITQIRRSSAFQDLIKYTTTAPFVEGGMMKKGEKGVVGVMEQVKFYETTEAPMCTVTAATRSGHGYGRYYFSFMFGKNSYGLTDFDGGLHTYVKTPGPNTTSDPLNQFSTAGYKAIFAAKVLNPSACLWVVSGKPTVYG